MTAILADALPAWRRLVGDIDAAHLLRDCGHVVIGEQPRHLAPAHVRFSATLPAETARLQRMFFPAQRSAFHVDGTGQIADLDALMAAMAVSFLSRGGQRTFGRVVGVEPGTTAVDATLDDRSIHRADRLVVAAGVWSADLMAGLGLRVPLIAERGYHLHYAKHDWPTDAPAVLVEDRALVLTPMRTGLRVTSFVELGRPDTAPDRRKWQRLERHVAELGIPVHGTPRRWFGSRPTLPDYLPMIGISRRYPQLAFAFGHQHLGLTLAATTAELLASELAGEHQAVIEPFALARYARRDRIPPSQRTS